jgi:hypothetical protein
MAIRSRLSALLLFGAGCASGPVEPFHSDYFTRPPEIWEKNGAYHLRLYEPNRDPVGLGGVETHAVGPDVHVWVRGRHSSGSHPNRLIPLETPAPRGGGAPRFLWRDPDGSLHVMEIRRV